MTSSNRNIFHVTSHLCGEFSGPLWIPLGWVGLWSLLWWAPSAKRKDHHGVSSRWSSVWHRSNTGLSSTQYEQIPIILGVWPFWLTPFFFRSITLWWAYGLIVLPLLKLLSFFWLTYCCSIGLYISVRAQLSLFRSTCKLVQSLLSFSPMICHINGALTFFGYYFNCFFLRLIKTCSLWVIYVREDNYSNV